LAGGALRIVSPKAFYKLKSLPSVLIDSARFRSRKKPGRIVCAIVDCDGTLYRADSTLEALKRVYGKQRAAQLHEGIIADVKAGKLTIDEGLVRGFDLLASSPGGFNIHLWEEIMEDFRKRGLFRQGLLEALMEIQSASGTTVVVATRASEISSRWIAKNMGLKKESTYYLGTGCRTDNAGIAMELTELIGTEDGFVDHVRSITKVAKAQAILEADSKAFSADSAAVISDDLLDRKEMLSAGWGVLIVPGEKSERNSFQKASVSFRLYDRMVMDWPAFDKNGRELKRRILSELQSKP